MQEVTDKIKQELREIEKKGGGIIQPEAVVEYAKNPNTELHSQFDWDDSEAARKYRIWQARQLLRIVITVEPRSNQEINAYVSLQSDRYNGGGYRSTISVLSKKDTREMLLQDALKDLEAFERKYSQLSELAEIFAKSKQIRNQYSVVAVK